MEMRQKDQCNNKFKEWITYQTCIEMVSMCALCAQICLELRACMSENQVSFVHINLKNEATVSVRNTSHTGTKHMQQNGVHGVAYKSV